MTDPWIIASLDDEGKDIEKIFNFLCEGIHIDGGHHKQWCLTEILKVLVGDLQTEELLDGAHPGIRG